ncbi:MAG: PxKF domain-containing protein [Caldilineaceae bacterium]
MSASTAIDRRLLRAAAAILLVLCALVGPHAGVLAQAPTGNENWDDRFVAVGANNTITAVVVDGAGNLYAGGTFTTIGGVTANRVAKWNGTIWTPLGNGTNGNVSTLALDPSGNLYVGGAFTTAGDVTANRIAMWNGSSWSDLGGGMDNTVSTLAFDRSGNLYAGGSFISAGGTAAKYIAKWNGSSWSDVSGGMDNPVTALAFDAGGSLYAGGSFINAGGTTAKYIARWNGSSWSDVGGGMSAAVNALALDSSGNLYAGGAFITAGGVPANRVAKWNGSSWSSLGSGTNNGTGSNVNALVVDGSGKLYAGGLFLAAGGLTARYVAMWDGSSWSTLGSGTNNGTSNSVNAFALGGSGKLYVAGQFDTAGAATVSRIAIWNGSSWSALGLGMQNSVLSFAFDGGGNLYASGGFAHAGGVPVKGITEWNGSGWSPLGSGYEVNGSNALAFDGNGNLYTGGSFTKAGGLTANFIAKWNGTAWSPLGTGMNSFVYALAVDSAGNLYAGGSFTNAGGTAANRIAMWNGSTWSAVGGGVTGIGDTVRALVMGPNGILYAGGNFTGMGGVTVNYVAKWDGTTWSPVGSGTAFGMNGVVTSLALDGNGNLYAGGHFGAAGGVAANFIAKWNGGTWSSLGTGAANGMNGAVMALAVDGKGNLYAGGNFTKAGGVTVNHVAKWDGSTWSPLGSGTDGNVSALAFGGGDLYVGGTFFNAGGKTSYYIARWKGTIEPQLTPPVVTAEPAAQTVCEGSGASFSAAASGVPVPDTQWQVSANGSGTWSDIAGATAPTLSFPAQAGDNGSLLRAVFTNSQGSAASGAALLTVNTISVVTTQPTDLAVDEGQQATFSAAASGSPAPSVQWQVSTDNGATWSDIAGATGPTFSFTAASGHSGMQFHAVFNNSCGTVTSNAAALAVIVDVTPPVITPSVVGTLGSNGWFIGDVAVTWSVVDGESAVTNQVGCEAQSVTVDTGGTSFTCSASSTGGSASQSISIQRDATMPAFGDCPAGGPFFLNSGVQAVEPISVDAAVSGLNPGASSLNGSIDTSTAGTKSVTFSAVDNAGNSTTKVCTYGVGGYHFTGFFAPVDNPPVLNQVKAGQSIPVKFSLGGNQGLGILAPNSPASGLISCPTGVTVDVIPTTATVSDSGLTYDPATDQFTYVWKTEKSWAGSCRQLNVTLRDGTTRSAGFNFTK